MESDSMEIDPPSDSAPLKSRDQVVRRLVQHGVPEEYLVLLYPGIVAFAMENKSRIPELVSSVLPTYEEVAKAIHAKSGAKKTAPVPTMKNRFGECMTWLQWLMFESDPSEALKVLTKMNVGKRGVCGAVWGHNDIAYRCRTCENDPTCAICVPCFKNGNHKDHDYSIIYTGGGCCDCGDVTAWKREGFCSNHKGAEQIQPLPEKFANSVGPVLDTLFKCWKNKLLAAETMLQENPRVSDRLVDCRTYANELTYAVVEMLLEFCKLSESLLSLISMSMISSVGLLECLVRSERILNDTFVKTLHELLLKLLGEPSFKYEFAKVFLNYYPVVVNQVIKEENGDSLKKYLLLPTFSVQIFTVPTLTPRLVKEVNLLATLFGSLGDIFVASAGEDGRLKITKWRSFYELTIRVVEDIRFVISHAAVPRYIIHEQRDLSRAWMRLLSFVQGMDPLKRETGNHVEEGNDSMHVPFALGHSIASIHSLLVDRAFDVSSANQTDNDSLFNMSKQDTDDGDNLRVAKMGRLSEESSVCSASGRISVFTCEQEASGAKAQKFGDLQVPESVTWLTYECLRAIEHWLGGYDSTSGTVLETFSASSSSYSITNFMAFKRTLSQIRKGKNIFSRLTGSTENQSKQHPLAVDPYTSTVSDDSTLERDNVNAAEFDPLHVLSLSGWPDITYDVSSQEISVHLPFHRFLSLLLQKALRRSYDGCVVAIADNQSLAIHTDFFGHFLGGCHPYGFAAFVMEHPLRVRVFCAEVRAGMWRKNGDAALLSCEWYHSARWSEGLESDLFLLQCCAALAPADLYVERILGRFGLSNYLSLSFQKSSEYEPALVREMLTLIIQILQERRFCGLTPAESLKRELIYKLAIIGDATRSQLVKSLPRDLSKFDKLQEILDTVAVYSNPSGFNQGMYSLRWTCWKELDLYHPRWNSRDLQVVEERYMRFCSVSPLSAQLPRWSNIYPPLKGVCRIATCKPVLQIIRAVLYYAVHTHKLTDSRASDGIVIVALHLLSLALDICFQQRESSDQYGESIPLLAFAGEEIGEELQYGIAGQSLLSLLVLLTRMHKKEDLDSFGNFNISSFIESLVKKFAEIDTILMTKLQQLAPELVSHVSQSTPLNGANAESGMASESEIRKAKARERQAAIMAKMKAEQSKFLSSIDCTEVDSSEECLPEASDSTVGCDLEESSQVVCSLCHDPNSSNPVSFLILLQKSRLLSFVDKGPASWEKIRQLDKEQVTVKEQVSTDANRLVGLSGGNPSSSSSSTSNINLLCTSNEGKETTLYQIEMLETDIYNSFWENMHNNMLGSISTVDDEKLAAESPSEVNHDDTLLRSYVATLSKEATNYMASESACSDRVLVEPTLLIPRYDGFGPVDCDGIHISSCGHAVHQGCLDRYLSSLRDRFNRRIVFEGGHIVDPDQGEFLCPVCRRLVNSILPAWPGDFHKVWKQSVSHSVNLNEESNSLQLRPALFLLQSVAKTVGQNNIVRAMSLQRNTVMSPNLEAVSRLLSKMHFSNKLVKFSRIGRESHLMILWDTLKYSLMSMEVAARCGRTSTSPSYSLSALHRELETSTGFVLSLLVKVVKSIQTKNSIHVLQRFWGLQLFSESICSGVSMDYPSGTGVRGGKFFPSLRVRLASSYLSPLRQVSHIDADTCQDLCGKLDVMDLNNLSFSGDMLSMLKDIDIEELYPNIQFWHRASDPILARDPFSSLMWVLFCLPSPFMSCHVTFTFLLHIFYVVIIAQAIITYCAKHQFRTGNGEDSLMNNICKILAESGCAHHYFVSSYVDPSNDINIMDVIRKLSFPYLRRCALLSKLLTESVPVPYGERDPVLDQSSLVTVDTIESIDNDVAELKGLQELEKMFKIPSLDTVLKDKVLQSLVLKWVHHFKNEFEARNFQCVLYSTPAVPFKLMQLPHIYQELLQRFIKERCPDCKAIFSEPALCLLCGRLCSPNWKPCCRESGCLAHAMSCGAGISVFLLIRRTTILLQRCARQAPWPSPYLDAFGEEDVDMTRGKPLHLNEERYANLAYMVASHGLDRSSKVLGQTTVGSFFSV